ncbi:MAG: site-specific integrase [Desulfobacteraceae bacterium]|nr:MAG: site-specific integrase [Desulfobacteraceae bacterium]
MAYVKIYAHVISKKKPTGKVYYYVHYKIMPPHGDGKWHDQSADTTRKLQAHKYMVTWVEHLKESFSEDRKPEPVNIPELFERRLAYMRERMGDSAGEYKKGTIEHYVLTFKHFNDFLASKGYSKNRPLTSSLLEEYKLYRRNLGNSTNTVNMALSSLLATGHWGYKEKICEQVQVKKYEYVPESEALRSNQVYLFFKAIDEVEPRVLRQRGVKHTEETTRAYWRLAFSLYFFTGARRGEIANLAWKDIDFHRGIIHIQRERSKNKKPLELTPAPEDLEQLQRMKPADAQDNDRVFFHNPRHFWRTYRYYLEHGEGLGITAGKLRRLHTTRHTFATLSIDAGIPLAHLSKQLGHSGIAITADIYTHLEREQRRNNLEQLRAFINKETESLRKEKEKEVASEVASKGEKK